MSTTAGRKNLERDNTESNNTDRTEQRQVQVRTFTQGRILLPLIRFALPVLAALFLQAMYGAVDI